MDRNRVKFVFIELTDVSITDFWIEDLRVHFSKGQCEDSGIMSSTRIDGS